MFHELHDLGVPGTEETCDVDRGAVAEPDPDDLRRWSEKNAQAMKVLVLGHEDEAVRAGICPDGPVAARRQTNSAHVI